jgi:hypothetical protein
MKAYIKQEKKNSKEFWLFVDRGLQSEKVESIMGMFREEDDEDSVAYPILEDEIEAIRDACNEYLNSKNK